MDQLRRADADVAHITHPRRTSRWRLSRYNPRRRWNAEKYKVSHPIQNQKRKARSRFNYINPLFYIRRIKNNLKSVV